MFQHLAAAPACSCYSATFESTIQANELGKISLRNVSSILITVYCFVSVGGCMLVNNNVVNLVMHEFMHEFITNQDM
jgi:hypothetical protein